MNILQIASSGPDMEKQCCVFREIILRGTYSVGFEMCAIFQREQRSNSLGPYNQL